MGSLVKSKVNLVLCGHRHRPWQWKIENMQAIHAGSAAREKLRGFCNAFNTMKIEKGMIEPKLKIVDGGFHRPYGNSEDKRNLSSFGSLPTKGRLAENVY